MVDGAVALCPPSPVFFQSPRMTPQALVALMASGLALSSVSWVTLTLVGAYPRWPVVV